MNGLWLGLAGFAATWCAYCVEWLFNNLEAQGGIG